MKQKRQTILHALKRPTQPTKQLSMLHPITPSAPQPQRHDGTVHLRAAGAAAHAAGSNGPSTSDKRTLP